MKFNSLCKYVLCHDICVYVYAMKFNIDVGKYMVKIYISMCISYGSLTYKYMYGN